MVVLCNKERKRVVTVILSNGAFGFQQFSKIFAVKLLGKYAFDEYTLIVSTERK